MKTQIGDYTLTIRVSDPYTQTHRVLIEHPHKNTYELFLTRQELEQFVHSLTGYSLT